eukprot:scaffold35272_cov20-Tisochrysis_lutea.AAC.1
MKWAWVWRVQGYASAQQTTGNCSFHQCSNLLSSLVLAVSGDSSGLTVIFERRIASFLECPFLGRTS